MAHPLSFIIYTSYRTDESSLTLYPSHKTCEQQLLVGVRVDGRRVYEWIFVVSRGFVCVLQVLRIIMGCVELTGVDNGYMVVAGLGLKEGEWLAGMGKRGVRHLGASPSFSPLLTPRILGSYIDSPLG